MVLWLLPGSRRQLGCEGHLGHLQHAERTLQESPRQPDLVTLSFLSPADVVVRRGSSEVGTMPVDTKVVLWGGRGHSRVHGMWA